MMHVLHISAIPPHAPTSPKQNTALRRAITTVWMLNGPSRPVEGLPQKTLLRGGRLAGRGGPMGGLQGHQPSKRGS